MTRAEGPEGAAGRLVDHALDLTWSSISKAATTAAKTFLYDTLCVGVAGAAATNASAILAVASQWGEGRDGSVLGRPGVRLPAPTAAFVNAFQIHCQEFDCVHEPAVLHPMATVVAALRAEAERSGPYTGEGFLTALIVGVDIAVALGLASSSPLKFFRPATCGVFGSVAALARLRGLGRAQTLNAFGYALAFASGTMQAHLEGKPALAIQVANAARSAMVAVDLAHAGLSGPQGSIDGPFGYLSLFETQFDLRAVMGDLASVRRISEVSCKPFPTGRAAHGGLVAIGELMRSQGVTGAGVERVVFRAPPLIKRLVGRPAETGMDAAYARLCLAYLAAVALLRGEVGLGDFTKERLSDPAILALASRIFVEADETRDPAAFVPLLARVRTTEGEEITVRTEAMLGAPTNPLSPEQYRRKAELCLAFGGLEALSGPLADAIAGLELTPDVAKALSLEAPEVRMQTVD